MAGCRGFLWELPFGITSNRCLAALELRVITSNRESYHHKDKGKDAENENRHRQQVHP